MHTCFGRRKQLLLFCVAILGVVFAHCLQYNWTLHARLNLLLQGYVFCRLESPDSAILQLPVRPSEPVSKLVNSRGEYVGYLNPYGDFIPLSSTEKFEFRGGKTIAILHYSEMMFLVVAIGSLVNWLWCLRKRESLPRSP